LIYFLLDFLLRLLSLGKKQYTRQDKGECKRQGTRENERQEAKERGKK
jgi:hypothetical protein